MKAAWGAFRTFAVVTGGWILLLGGIVLMPLPGPGILIAFSGLVVLSTRYAWARRLRKKASAGVETATKESVANKKRIFVSSLGAMSAIAVGVTLIIDPRLPSSIDFTLLGIDVGPHIPGAGLTTGIAAIIGGLVAIGLLVYAKLAYKDDDKIEPDIVEDLRGKGMLP